LLQSLMKTSSDLILKFVGKKQAKVDKSHVKANNILCQTISKEMSCHNLYLTNTQNIKLFTSLNQFQVSTKKDWVNYATCPLSLGFVIHRFFKLLFFPHQPFKGINVCNITFKLTLRNFYTCS